MAIRFQKLALYRLRFPLHQPWRTAYGEELAVETVVAKVTGDHGEAWVESCPLATPLYLPETAGGTFRMVHEHLGPLLMGSPLDSPGGILDLLSRVRGNTFAKALLELCWWGLEATERELPLRRLFEGGDGPVPVAEGVGLCTDSEVLVAKAGELLARGVARVKVKFGRAQSLEPLHALREAYPEAALAVDCNGAFSLADYDFLKGLDAVGLDMVEQPLDWRDLHDHAALQSAWKTPICLDESIRSALDAARALQLGACRVINVKVGRVGGLMEALGIIDRCGKAGAGVWVGSMFESDLGNALNLELASACGELAHEIHGDGHWHAGQLAEPAFALGADGRAAPGDGVFLGRVPIPERVAVSCVEEAVLEAPRR